MLNNPNNYWSGFIQLEGCTYTWEACVKLIKSSKEPLAIHKSFVF